MSQADKVVWADAYKFWVAYHDGRNEKIFWDNLVHDADLMCKKHNGDEFFSKLIYECVEDIERRFNKRLSNNC